MNLAQLDLAALSTDELTALAGTLLHEVAHDRQENQLEYYTCPNPDAEPVHYSMAREIGIGGGHRSSKSDVMLAEMAIRMTGVVPKSLERQYPREKLRGPIRARLFCTSFQNCPTPDQRVLTADLRWVPAGDLSVGDRLFAFDESPGGAGPGRARMFTSALVLSATPRREDVYRIVMSDGTELRSTATHPWLTRARHQGHNHGWTFTRDLRIGDELPRWLIPWTIAQGYEAGWLAGFFDGEGWVVAQGDARRSFCCAAGQKPGPVLDQAVTFLSRLGARIGIYDNGGGLTRVQLSGRAEALRFLGMTRPRRLLQKFVPAMAGSLKSRSTPQAQVTAIESLGARGIVGLMTSTGTFLCEGFGAHNSFDTQLKRKLQWNEWDGPGLPGSDRGHWGWIPKRFLLNGSWDQSWSEKHRTLRLTNDSRLSVLSYEQSLDDVKVGSFHLICEDELGPESFHRQNKMRIMETHGQLYTAATPPDDRSAAITAAWFYDQIYVPGLHGTDPAVFAVTLFTDRNRLLLPEDIAWLSKGLTEEQKQAQLYGRFLHLAGLVFPEFTDRARTWCLSCERQVFPVDGSCPECRGTDLAEYAHVVPDEPPLPSTWPLLFFFDPHPRKPLAGLWVRVDPTDDWWVEDEIEVPPLGGPAAVRREIERYEEARGWHPVWRQGDSKMTNQINEFAGESWSIGKALRDAGFEFDDANTSDETGFAILRDAMRVNVWSRQPRLHVRARCRRLIYGMTHWVWDEYSRRVVDRDVKERPRQAHSDWPVCLKFLANNNPTWQGLWRLVTGERMRYIQGKATNRATGY